MLNTPILFIIFNRPETTIQVFEAIRKAKPKKLFIAADGPRSEKLGEEEKSKETRKIVSKIDWECEVQTLFRTENLGCAKGVSGAISWFFEHVEQGIILEDDCLPSQSFFYFCQDLLEKYKDDCRIQQIAGANLLKEWKRGSESYFFSNSSGIWGWATWKRAWQEYDLYVSKWKVPQVVDLFKAKFPNPNERDVYVNGLNKALTGSIDTWDYQWVFTRIINGRIGIIPKVNLISNIGFGADATHTKDENSRISNIKAEELSFPLIEPIGTLVDEEFDSKLSFTYYPSSSPLNPFQKIKSFLRSKIAK